MNDLILVKSEQFGQVQCDFWQDTNSEIFMEREQIAKALGHSNPRTVISSIHRRHKEILGKYASITLVNGRQTYYYSAKGVYEICRWSRQPKADAFMDWVWEMIERIRKGQLVPARNKLHELAGGFLYDAAELAVWKLAIPLPENAIPYAKKLQRYITNMLNEMEREMGKLTKQIVDAFFEEFTPRLLRGEGRRDVYFAFKREVEKRIADGIDGKLNGRNGEAAKESAKEPVRENNRRRI